MTNATRYFALIMGIAFLLIGVMGFIPAFVTPATDAHDVTVHANHGLLLGLFPVNLLHNLVHILFGVWGIAAYMTSYWGARLYARSVAIIYALLAVMGLIPGLETTFGLIPIHGHDVWLHAVIALAAAIFGWALIGRAHATDTSDTTHERPHLA
jgi:hypothetical protein